MERPSKTAKFNRSGGLAARALGRLLAPSLLVAACGQIPVDGNIPEPAGVLRGTVNYTGPLPCTQAGRVVGGVVILVFSEDLLPPPEGLGTTAVSVGVVTGDVLFEGVQGSIPSNPDGSTACPPEGGPTISVGAPFELGPLVHPGRYQLRAFYDRDGDFSPILKTHQLPTAGDIGGGAVANPVEAAQGKKPVYQTLAVGVPDANGKLKMPEAGALIEGITVNVGLKLPFGRPIAHIAEVLDTRPLRGASPEQLDPRNVKMPADMRFGTPPTANPTTADEAFLRLRLKAGLPAAEAEIAGKAPFSLQVMSPYNKLFAYANRDASGNVVPIIEKTTPVLADLFPQVILARLNPADPEMGTPYAEPAVIISALVADQNLLKSTAGTWGKRTTPVPLDEITAILRPSVICTNPTDADATVTLVTPGLDAQDGKPVIEDLVDLKQKIAGRFRKPIEKVRVVEGCLPPGKYSINLVYDTGQAWTMPNEAGFCDGPLEQSLLTGGVETGCTQNGASRPVLASQRIVVSVGGEQDAGYCETQAETRAASGRGDKLDASKGEKYVNGVPSFCLSATEIANPALVKSGLAP